MGLPEISFCLAKDLICNFWAKIIRISELQLITYN